MSEISEEVTRTIVINSVQRGLPGAAGPSGTTSWNGITDKPATFTPSSHTHSPNDLVEPVVTQNTSLTLTAADSGKIYIKEAGGDSTLTLPTSGLVTGRTRFFVVNLTESYLTISASVTIHGKEMPGTSIQSRVQGSSAELVWLGASWLLRKATGEWV